MKHNSFPIANLASQIQPFHVMKILGEAKQLQQQGKDVIHMEIGEPDFPSLDCVNEAAYQATLQGHTHYTPTLGLTELRLKLSEFYRCFYQAQVDFNQIMVTPGSSSALHIVLTAILDAGDQVIMADPTYPCNRQFVALLKAHTLSVPVSLEANYQLTLEAIQAHWTPKVKAVMIASPANPTGSVIEQTELVKIAQFLAQQQAYLIVDEIYQGLVYGRPAETVLANELPDNVIVINSFSKFFGMTGWRVGWCVAPKHLMPVLDKLGQNLYLSAPTPSQYGALSVLESEALQLLEQRRQIFEDRRNQLISALQAKGWSIPLVPQGAFYLYLPVGHLTDQADQWALRLLQQQHVAITPGKDFGTFQAQQRIRLAYTTDTARLLEAVERISAFIASEQAVTAY